jgi:hypothetical protein
MHNVTSFVVGLLNRLRRGGDVSEVAGAVLAAVNECGFKESAASRDAALKREGRQK